MNAIVDNIEELFDVHSVAQIITKYNYSKVVLQFIDEHLEKSVDVFQVLSESLPSVEFYIVGDSSFGASADDVSAMHVHCDLLVYFGADFSCTATIPIVIVPCQKKLQDSHLIERMYSLASQNQDLEISNVIILAEPSYAIATQRIVSKSQSKCKVSMADVRANLNLQNWSPVDVDNSSNESSDFVLLGGYQIPRTDFDNPITTYWYIGDNNNNHFKSILLRIPDSQILTYCPEKDSIQFVKGCDLKDYRERYGGVVRVKEANVIGILIGSMGISDKVTLEVLSRITQLIEASGKKVVVFVMGRLTESKLCNFPEVDIFCLIATENSSLIKAKTFHVPLVTPWELELGLGARNWESFYITDVHRVLVEGGYEINELINNIKNQYTDNEIEHDDQSEKLAHSNVESTALISKSSNYMVIESCKDVLIDKFKQREYVGLEPISEETCTAIQIGLYGIAQGYENIGS